jgi:uncharacterized protein (DUF58 family)
MPTALLSNDFLQKLEYLALVSRRAFNGTLLARKRTRKLGSGLEFADHREYTSTDDFRYIDWNLFARYDTLLLKRFQEEEDLHVYFLLDCSRSMGLGTPPKLAYAYQVTAALAYIALADLDRVAVTAFADDLFADFPLTRGKGRILTLLQFLDNLEPRGEATNLARACSSFVHRGLRRGLVVLVSDLYDPAGFEQGLDMLRHHRFDVRVVQVHDRQESSPDFLGELELVDAETAEIRKVILSERSLRDYRRLFIDFQNRLTTYCQRHEMPCTTSCTAVPFDELLLGMMRTAGMTE